jgi:hypothetical protein
MEVDLAMQQKKRILKEDKEYFLALRTIQYETGFEADVQLVGSRYEIWPAKYKDKYEKDIIEEYTDGKVVHYCELYTADSDEGMLQIFAAKVNSDK